MCFPLPEPGALGVFLYPSIPHLPNGIRVCFVFCASPIASHTAPAIPYLLITLGIRILASGANRV